MFPNTKICLYPHSPQEAVRVLSDTGKRGLLLAGGTSTALMHDPRFDTLLDITRIGFNRIEPTPGGWAIGCNVRIQEVAAHSGLKDCWNGMLSDAAQAVGSRPIRNAATMGGNAVQLYRWSDPPVALLAMNAQFRLMGPNGERTLGADEFFSRHPKQVLQPAEILVSIEIPKPTGAHGGAFVKFARTAFDLAVVDVAVCLEMESGRCKEARVVVGGTRNLPWRCADAEAQLRGKKLTAAVVLDAAKTARQSIQTADDVRTKKEYRLKMVEILVRRTIDKAAGFAV